VTTAQKHCRLRNGAATLLIVVVGGRFRAQTIAAAAGHLIICVYDITRRRRPGRRRRRRNGNFIEAVSIDSDRLRRTVKSACISADSRCTHRTMHTVTRARTRCTTSSRRLGRHGVDISASPSSAETIDGPRGVREDRRSAVSGRRGVAPDERRTRGRPGQHEQASILYALLDRNCNNGAEASRCASASGAGDSDA